MLNRAVNPTGKHPVGIMLGIIILSFLFFFIVEYRSQPQLAQTDYPAELYSNQAQNNLQKIYIQALSNAQKSILLITYTLSDHQIIGMLKQKAQQGVHVDVICDAKANPHIKSKLSSEITITAKEMKGIMHQKILVVDEEKIWLGSANMTSESLKLHGNLVLAVSNLEMGRYITKKSQQLKLPYQGPPYLERSYLLQNQLCELWFLPDNTHAIKRISSLMQEAKKSIRVAMFTWTRMDLAKEIVKAQQRGIFVEVVLDQNSAKGAGLEITNYLKANNVPVKISTSKGLLHYKTMIVDDEILVNGSANWTKAAFNKNDDCFLILQNLTNDQKAFLQRLWRSILLESK